MSAKINIEKELLFMKKLQPDLMMDFNFFNLNHRTTALGLSENSHRGGIGNGRWKCCHKKIINKYSTQSNVCPKKQKKEKPKLLFGGKIIKKLFFNDINALCFFIFTR